MPDFSEGELADLKRSLGLGGGEKVVVAGSTRKGEEERLLKAFAEARKERPDLRFVVAPRHIERAGEIERAAQETGFTVVRRTQARPDDRWDVLILDTIGELARVYALSDAAFVGGSLVDWGGHNILEPAYYGKPVFFGPHMQNFARLADSFIRAGAARIVRTDAELVDMFLLRDAEALGRMGAAGPGPSRVARRSDGEDHPGHRRRRCGVSSGSGQGRSRMSVPFVPENAGDPRRGPDPGSSLGAAAAGPAAEPDKDEGSFSRAFQMTPDVLGKTLASPVSLEGPGLPEALGRRRSRPRPRASRTRASGTASWGIGRRASKDFFGFVTRFGDRAVSRRVPGGALRGRPVLRERRIEEDGVARGRELSSPRASSRRSSSSRSDGPGRGRRRGAELPSVQHAIVVDVHPVRACHLRLVRGHGHRGPDGQRLRRRRLLRRRRHVAFPIYEDKHWASDVLVGSAIGYFTAKKICALNRDGGPKLTASFGPVRGGQAVTLSLSFCGSAIAEAMDRRGN